MIEVAHLFPRNAGKTLIREVLEVSNFPMTRRVTLRYAINASILEQSREACFIYNACSPSVHCCLYLF